MSSKGIEEGGSGKVVRDADKFQTLHMLAFILAGVLGREYSGWQIALSQGFGQFMIAQIIVGAAFINCYLLMADVWSAVPFSGGLYGLARAVIGFYPGFLVGCADCFLYITHSAMGALGLGYAIVAVFELPSKATIGIVAGIYIFAAALAIQPSVVVMRRSFVVLSTVSVLILVMWCLGSFKFSDWDNASLHVAEPASAIDNWFDGSMKDFMFFVPYASLPYAGTKVFTLMVSFTSDPKTTIPRAVLIALPFIFCLNMVVVFVNAAQPFGILHTAKMASPMAVGWMLMFETALENTKKVTLFLTIPATFARVYSYVLPCGALFQSLGKTNLLPSVMMLKDNVDHTRGVLWTATLGFVMCFWIHYQPELGILGLCLLLTTISNSAAMYCYIKLKILCPTLERTYTNSFGITGAVLSIIVQILLFIGMAFYSDNYFPIMGIAAMWFALTVYYYAFAEKGQTLCKEEDKVFLLLHVKNFNHNKKKRRQHKGGNRVQPNAVAHSPTAKRSNHASHSEHGAATSGLSSEHSSSAAHSTPLASAGLWEQFRANMFGNNSVAPANEHHSSHASSNSGGQEGDDDDDDIETPGVSPRVNGSPGATPRLCPVPATPTVDYEGEAAGLAAVEEGRSARFAEGSTRQVEMV